MRKVLIGAALATLLPAGGCALTSHGESAVNDYAAFYTAESAETPDSLAAMRAAPPTRSPQVVQVARWDAGVASAYARQGYVLIGSSSFTSAHAEPEHDAIEQGVSVGADLVIVQNPEDEGTSPAKGAAGQPSVYGAGYFVKMRYRFGAQYRDLSEGERRQLQTDRGVYVTSVVDSSPAHDADILPGDVILAVDGQPPNGEAGLSTLIDDDRGQTVEMTIVRSGKVLSKRVSILE